MRYLKILFVPTTIFLSLTAKCQFTDSFSDGNIVSSPEWSGDVSRFVVVDGRAKLQAPPVAGVAYLATPSHAIYQAEWSFSVQLDFTPSSANYTKVYLVSDQQALPGALSGYFIKIGNTTREVSLYRQTGTAEVEIIDGVDDRINQPVVVLRVRATRDDKGTWELFSAVGLGGFVMEGTVLDNTHSLSGWFGVQCIYSSTRSDKFWFDDFVVTGSVVPDLQPPRIVTVEAPDSRQLVIHFSEALTEGGTGFIQVKDIGFPERMVLTDATTLTCTLPLQLQNGITYAMNCHGFKDLSGNAMLPTEISVRYFVPAVPGPKSVLITEVFSDPTPEVGLPAVEYVEIYNPGSEPFELHNWQVTDGSSKGIFPEYVMLPGMYVVVTSTAGAGLFGGVNVIPLANFPSLNNSGDRLLLMDETGLKIDSIQYDLSWYRDEDKAAGGWSLELIDPGNPCGEADNWTASENDLGGTPGIANSVLASKPDVTPPRVVSVYAKDSIHISIQFNELLRSSSVWNADIQLNPLIPVVAASGEQSLHGIELTLDKALLLRTAYEIRLVGIQDCNGNLMEPTTFTFGLSEPADSLDVYLSEVLFNPRSGGVDFVEVFNASAKYLNLQGWTLSNGEAEMAVPPRQLAPNQWLAFTSDPVTLRNQYVSGNLEYSNLPSMPDDEGLILLRAADGSLLDQVYYKEVWHSELLQSTEGASLERIDFSVSAQTSDNWVSAASTTGFATPGLANSHLRSAQTRTSEVTVVPEIFSPVVSGVEFVQIQYRFSQPGYVSNVRIFDRQGLPVKELASNATLGNEGFLRWDGDRENGTRAAAGYYILWFECFDLTGHVETIRRRIVLVMP